MEYMMDDHFNRAVREFAVNVLGCGCPEEAFSTVEVTWPPISMGGVDLAFLLGIGGRLMVVGVALKALSQAEPALAQLVAEAIKSRDGKGLNRLRIVVVADGSACESKLIRQFERIPGVDDRVHLHIVTAQEMEPFLASGGERREMMEKYKTEPTVWHEMEGPFIGGREHYQEKSYGFESPQADKGAEEEGEDQGEKEG